MLYREIMALCSEIHTKHINTLCGQNAELFKVNCRLYMLNNDQQPVCQLYFQPQLIPNTEHELSQS